MQTGLRSVAPCEPVRTWYISARLAIFLQVGDAAGVHHRGADVVDELLLDQLLAVIDGVEHFAHRQRRGGVLADQAEPLLQFRRRGILQPEQMVRLQFLAQRAPPRSASAGDARRAADARRARTPCAAARTAAAQSSRYFVLTRRFSGGRPFSAGS